MLCGAPTAYVSGMYAPIAFSYTQAFYDRLFFIHDAYNSNSAGLKFSFRCQDDWLLLVASTVILFL